MDLPGQETMLANWAALAETSAGARLVRSPIAVAAVFPAWAPLNNAIVPEPDHDLTATAIELRSLYAAAGVEAWALWIPSRTADLDAADDVRAIDGFTRDGTTLVMQADLRPGRDRHDAVVSVSLEAALRAGEEPVPVSELGEPMTTAGLTAWAVIDGDAAVSSAWTYRHGTDCGIYAVSTVPDRQRRGLATTLLRHVLAVAEADGARTATLQSTPDARHLYATLGFVAAGRYEEWVPA